MTRYANATRVQQGLDQNAEHTGAPTLLWIYRPEAFGGQGRAAIAIGNPDTADDTVRSSSPAPRPASRAVG